MPALLAAVVPGLLTLALTSLMLVRGRVGGALMVVAGGSAVTLLGTWTARVRQELLSAALADIPQQAQPQAWRDAARGGASADYQARAWAVRVASYQVARRRGAGLIDPAVKTLFAIAFTYFAVVESPWLALLTLYSLVQVATFITTSNQCRRRLSTLTSYLRSGS